jgi:hypothetical protein
MDIIYQKVIRNRPRRLGLILRYENIAKKGGKLVVRLTDRTIEGNRVVFNIDNGLDQDLLRYCDNICKENCGSTFSLECGDCHVTRLYLSMMRLAEYEDTGLIPEEVKKLQSREKEAIKDMTDMANYMRQYDDTSDGCCFACAFDDTNTEACGECPGYEADECFMWRGLQK